MKNISKILIFISFAIVFNFIFVLPAEANWVQVVPSTYTMSGGVGYINGLYVSLSGYKDQPYSGITMTFSNGANTYVWPWFDNSPLLGSFGSGGAVLPGSNYYLTANGPVVGFAGPFTVAVIPTSPPSITGTNMGTITTSPVYSNTRNLVISGTAAAGSSLSVMVNGLTQTSIYANGSGDWSYAYTATADTSNMFQTFNTVAASNIVFIVPDTIGPIIASLTSNPAGPNITVGTPSFNWSASDSGSGLHPTATYNFSILDSSSNVVASSGGWTTATSFTPTIPLAPGYYTFKLNAKDKLANTTTQNLSFTIIDIQPPVGTFSITTFEGGGYTNSANPLISLTVSDASTISHYCIRECPPQSTTAPTASDSGWAPFSTPLQRSYISYNTTHPLSGGDGTKTLYVWFKDSAGNIGIATNSPQTVKLDTKAPIAGREGNGTWEYLGGQGFTGGLANCVSLFVENGTPYVAYIDSASQVIVQKFNGTSWQKIGSTAGSSAGAYWTSLFVENGVPYVAYEGVSGYQATILFYNGSAWQTLGNFGSSAGYDYSSIYVYNGIPYIAYANSGSGSSVSVMKYVTGGWQYVGNAGFINIELNALESISLKFSNGTPYIAVRDYSKGNKVTVLKLIGTNWSVLGSQGFSSTRSDFISLDVINDVPYVAYEDFFDNLQKVSVMKFNGTSWTYVGPQSFSDGSGAYTSLNVSSGVPYVAYTDFGNGTKVTVKKFNGNSWENLGSAGFSSGNAWYDSIAVSNGSVFVAYRDWGYDDGNKVSCAKFSETINDGLLINNGARLTTKPELKMKIFGTDWHSGTQGSGVKKYLIKYNDSGAPPASAAWLNMPATFDNTFPATQEVDFILPATEPDGLKIFYLWFKDKAGNVSSAAQKSIKYDTHPPVEAIAGNIAIAGPHPEFLVTREVMLQLNAESGQDTVEGYYDIKVSHYFLADCSLGTTVTPPNAASAWKDVATPVTPYSEVVPYTVTSAGDGTKEIYVWYKDIAGNMSLSSKCVTYLDTSIPHGSFTINSGTEWSISPLVTLNLTALSATAVNGYFVSTSATAPTAADVGWRPVSPPAANYTADVPYMLGRTAGIKTVYVWYKSTSGIVSAVSSDTIKLDCDAPVPGNEQPGAWVNVGNQRFTPNTVSNVCLHVHNGTPYVSFEDQANSNKASVMKFDGTSWTYLGGSGFSPGLAYLPSICFDGSIPYVAFSEISQRVCAMNYDGSNWINIGYAGYSNGYLGLKISNGFPYIVYGDASCGNKATVMKYQGTAWSYVGTAGFTPGSAPYTSIDVHNDTPYVSFSDYVNGQKISVMKFDGTSWVYLGNSLFSDGFVGFTSIAVHEGTPFVAYIDQAHSDKVTVMKFDGTSWTSLGGAGFSTSVASATDALALKLYKGKPFIAYADQQNGNKISVMKFDGINWTNVGIPGFSDFPANTVSLDIFENQIFIAYRDGGSTLKPCVMKYELKRGPGLEINNGDQFVYTTAVKLNLAATDDYAGVTAYYASESPEPPNASTTWLPVTMSAGGTAEVNFNLSTVAEPVTVHVWFRDDAGNISPYSKKKVNPRLMRTEAAIGGAVTFNQPFLIARDSDENLIVGDNAASNATPLFKLLAAAGYASGSRIITPGGAIDCIDNTLNGLVVFANNAVGTIESARKRFSVFDAAGLFVGGFAKSVNMLANYHGYSTTADIRSRIFDKYASGGGSFAEAAVMTNQTSDRPLDLDFAPAKLEIFSNAAFTTPIGETVSSSTSVYLRLSGAGGNPNAINSIIASVTSADDPKGIAVQLVETSTNSDVFEGTLTLGAYSNHAAGTIGAAGNQIITVQIRSINGILNRIFKTSAKLGHDLKIDLGDGITMDFVLIRAGTFQMGQGGVAGAIIPVHTVTITKDFYMSKYELTRLQWLKVIGTQAPGTLGNYPADCSWNQACLPGGFLDKLNQTAPEGFTGFRLPTEAEWEYACRAGTTTLFYWGDDYSEPTAKQYCWYDKNAKQSVWTVPHADTEGVQLVGQKLPNAWGLYDMCGNAWEWCSDWKASYTSSPEIDPAGPPTGTLKVIRGGCYTNPCFGAGVGYLYSAGRGGNLVTSNVATIRLVLPKP